jgi:tRNA dimethylallyltransferase
MKTTRLEPSIGGRPVVVLAGPTAAGKTAAALHVAHLWKARIVSADAMQVYRGMDIGTGKAPPFVLRRFPHDCVDILEPDQRWCANDFARAADGAMAESDPVLVVGGTVLYLRAFLYGLVPAPSADPALRAELSALPDPHAALAEVDPVLAARLHPHDLVRIVRGLEVWRITGTPLSELQAADPMQARRPAVVLWMDRDDLRLRIDARVERMIARGVRDEAGALLDRGFGRDLKPMQSLGYRHFCDHVLDGLSLEEARWRTQRDTWTFARKQRTWARQHATWIRVAATDRGRILGIVTEAWGKPSQGLHPPFRG